MIILFCLISSHDQSGFIGAAFLSANKENIGASFIELILLVSVHTRERESPHTHARSYARAHTHRRARTHTHTHKDALSLYFVLSR